MMWKKKTELGEAVICKLLMEKTHIASYKEGDIGPGVSKTTEVDKAQVEANQDKGPEQGKLATTTYNEISDENGDELSGQGVKKVGVIIDSNIKTASCRKEIVNMIGLTTVMESLILKRTRSENPSEDMEICVEKRSRQIDEAEQSTTSMSSPVKQRFQKKYRKQGGEKKSSKSDGSLVPTASSMAE
ncbi:hypothetical protein COLO4_14914 [Corchorus olitorius]|uniref:Uncharacterized protein n=1 Tax=Corchorus olitorius TaxID=93759 RepID=A0A1R3JQD7_9ROSI|nr:hypothetical protein COLO4_14914 [Corchorus olitorius]